MDYSDRYLNNKAVKFYLQANNLAEGERIMALFSREGDELNIFEMQTMWYEIELAEAHFRLGDFEKAVEFFEKVEKHLIEMFEG